ncbi:hypothetical protein B0H14DRAFT_3760351 [Mycena olivaceomarginata]|nr:hypothetical protein B0H14DRAFT_3760351 [Mycena olivaceomarginata]
MWRNRNLDEGRSRDTAFRPLIGRGCRALPPSVALCLPYATGSAAEAVPRAAAICRGAGGQPLPLTGRLSFQPRRLSAGLSIRRLWCSGAPSDNTVSYMDMKLSVTASLPYDLQVVLGRDWLFFCCQTLPHAAFHLSSGTVEPGQQSSALLPPNSLSQPMDLDPPSQSNNYVSNRSACRVLCQDFESAADMSKAVLSIILDANHKQISTESLLHVRSVIGKHAQSVGTADTNAYSSTSITDFFNSFETHRKPDLLSIAALHHIQIPQSATAGTQF